MGEYEDKLAREKAWYAEKDSGTQKHFLNSRLFRSKRRHDFNYAYARQEMGHLVEHLISTSGIENPSLLIAPVGSGNDLRFILPLSNNVTGVDLTPEALEAIKDPGIRLLQADMSDMRCFSDAQFDIVLVPLFFHHFNTMHRVFVKELVRVLKPGGYLVSLEPSILHPLSWVTRSLRRVVGNITNQVEDEAPFFPRQLTRAMVDCGLQDVSVRGASFSHNRLPVMVAKTNNLLTRPLLSAPILSHFAWLCLFQGRKPQ